MLREDLKEFLDDSNRLCIVGIGNDFRGDDGLGPFVINGLSKSIENSEDILLINAQSVPENFTGKIRKFNPSHIVIIDAVLMDKKPGTIKLVQKEEISQVNISTHAMSLSFFVKYLESDGPLNVIFIGIQPLSMDIDDKLSPIVYDSSKKLINLLKDLIKN